MTIDSATISNGIDMPEAALDAPIGGILPPIYGNVATTSYDMVPVITAGTIVSFSMEETDIIATSQKGSKKIGISLKESPFQEEWVETDGSIVAWVPPDDMVLDVEMNYQLVYYLEDPGEEITESGSLIQRLYWKYEPSLETFKEYVLASRR